jgi:putative phosphoribosyl transferase
LDAPLDVFTVRKLGVPGHEELAMGAIASGGIRVLNADVVEGLNISQDVIDAVADREKSSYIAGNNPIVRTRRLPTLKIDFSFWSMTASRPALPCWPQFRPCKAEAPPMCSSPHRSHRGAPSRNCGRQQIKWFVLSTPEPFHGVGQWYEDFAQTTDSEVREFLRIANERHLEHV